MEKPLKHKSRLIISYLTLRKLIGIMGFSFPLILLLGGLLTGTEIQDSISEYYHTPLHDIFVAILCIVATFLFAYTGYERKDEIAGKVASICAVGVALIPTTIENNPTPNQIYLGYLHLAFATGYFLMIAYFCLMLFTKTGGEKISVQKKNRNAVYKVCGYIILICLALIAIYSALPSTINQTLEIYKPFFWLESIAIFAFGFAWLVKGRAILGN